MPETTVIVTGGAGFIGGHVVRRCLARGYETIVLDNLAVAGRERADELEKAGATFAEVDVRDADQVNRAFRGMQPQKVIHLAAHHFIPYCNAHPADTIRTNAEGLQHVLDALPASVGRFVFTSTLDVYAPADVPVTEEHETRPINVYGATKLLGEQLIALWRGSERGCPTVILRLCNVYGPGETNPHVLPDICDGMRTGNELKLGNTDARRDYVFVGDVADIIVEMMERDREGTVNIGTGTSYSVADLVEAIRAITGRALVITTDPSKLRKVERMLLQADIARLDRWLPERPRTQLNDGLTRLLESEGLLG